jgi:hypothetical protein
MNSLISNDIKIYLDSGEVTKLIYNTEPEGIFYPMEEINSEVQFLDGFSWNQALRPRKPYFPIP